MNRKSYEQDLSVFGFQAERLCTGQEQMDCSDLLTVKHIHTMKVHRWNVLFSAEVDAKTEKSSELVEIKASNERYWGTRVMLQMISSGSVKLCHVRRNGNILSGVSIKNLSIVAQDSLRFCPDFVKTAEDNIIDLLKTISENVKDDCPYKVSFLWSKIHLTRLKHFNIFPPRQIIAQLLEPIAEWSEIEELMRPLSLEDEEMLSKITYAYHIDCIKGKCISSGIVDEYLQGYLRKRDQEMKWKRSHFFAAYLTEKILSEKLDYENV